MTRRLFSLLLATALVACAASPDWQDLRKQIRGALFVSEPQPAIRAQSFGQFFPAPGIIAEKVAYQTEFGMLVPAVVYRPMQVGATKRPALIVVNGHGGDKYSWYSFYAGILYARAGAVVLTYDPIGEGERNRDRKSGTRAHDRLVPPPEMARRMGGLMMTDVMQAVSYLASRTDVDAGRIAAVGYSMGSFVLGLTCATETRLRACVLAGGGDLDGPGGYWDTNGKKMCQAIPYQSLSFLGDRPAMLFALSAKRGPTLIFNGSADEVVEIPSHGAAFFRDMRERTARLLETQAGVFDFDFNAGGGHRPYFITKPVGLWLEKQLKFPNWTAASIQSMPETHISEWAAATGVFMDKGYSDEHREGGTMALGENMPAVSRAELNVFPDEVWQAYKDDLTYEAWIKHAQEHLTDVPAK